jgi:WXG100 family type VII secretion target
VITSVGQEVKGKRHKSLVFISMKGAFSQMADEIKADYEELEQVASRFTNQAQAIQQMAQKVRSSYDRLEDGGWIGRGSDAFFAEMRGEIFPACQRFQDVLDEAGAATRDVVRDFRQAEQEASAPFRSS